MTDRTPAASPGTTRREVPLAPTAQLRWVWRAVRTGDATETGATFVVKRRRVLEQYWDQDVPDYMRSRRGGEWREIDEYEEPADAQG